MIYTLFNIPYHYILGFSDNLSFKIYGIADITLYKFTAISFKQRLRGLFVTWLSSKLYWRIIFSLGNKLATRQRFQAMTCFEADVYKYLRIASRPRAAFLKSRFETCLVTRAPNCKLTVPFEIPLRSIDGYSAN